MYHRKVTQTVTDLYFLCLLTMPQHSKQNKTLTSTSLYSCVYSVPSGEEKEEEEALTPFVVISIHGQIGKESQHVSKQPAPS